MRPDNIFVCKIINEIYQVVCLLKLKSHYLAFEKSMYLSINK